MTETPIGGTPTIQTHQVESFKELGKILEEHSGDFGKYEVRDAPEIKAICIWVEVGELTVHFKMDRLSLEGEGIRYVTDRLKLTLVRINEDRKRQRRGPVLQPWVCNLTFMQQSVLITACRGPDGLSKNHISKQLCRWMRRCFLYSAFEKKVFTTPYQRGGGSFTGPCLATDERGKICIDAALDQYLKSVDEVPHHFHLHLMHAAEILGYKHPYLPHRKWWNKVYVRIVKDAHLNPESEEQMDKRLGDCHEDWIAAEEVTAD